MKRRPNPMGRQGLKSLCENSISNMAAAKAALILNTLRHG